MMGGYSHPSRALLWGATAIPSIALAWGVGGFALALSALDSVNADARGLAVALSIGGPLAAILGAVAVRLNRLLIGAVALVISVVTPTYFAWAINLVPLMLVVALFGLSRFGRTQA